jgi:lipopolysaccharide export system protein LptA
MTFRHPCLFLAALMGLAVLRAEDVLPPTIIECTGLAETISSDTETIATFHDQVVVTGNNLKVTCDFLKVIASRKGDPNATIGKYGYFKSLIATGHVKIIQGDREATCGRAEIFPGEDRVVLSESPTVRSTNDQYVATGPRMILFRGERRAVIEPEAGVGGRFTLPTIKDLGFSKDKPADKPAPPSQP